MRRARITTAAAALLVTAVAASPALAAPTKLEAVLTGGAEVPTPGPAAGEGTARITLKPGKRQVCWKLTAKKLGSMKTAAHIHRGRAGKAGPVVVPLGAAYQKSGCIRASKSLIKAIRAKPGRYYVNIHTVDHPAGAVRGQLGRL